MTARGAARQSAFRLPEHQYPRYPDHEVPNSPSHGMVDAVTDSGTVSDLSPHYPYGLPFLAMVRRDNLFDAIC